jgi:hypothetical protein
VAEAVAPGQANPLSSDSELFQMYLDALDTVLGAPDVRRSFDEFGLSAGILRMRMLNDAREVLKTAAREFAVYQDAVAHELSALARDPTMARRRSLWNISRLWRELPQRFIVVKHPSRDLFRNAAAWDFGPGVAAARFRLMAAITETELLAQVRTFINTARQSRFGHIYSVASSPALSEVYNSANRVPTGIEAELAGLLDRLDGASIGVAGPRGAGKSTLIRGYCEEVDWATDHHDRIGWSSFLGVGLPAPSWGDLRCMVAAPVDYVARDFVLHLFAAFCGVVISGYSNAGKHRRLFLGLFWGRRVLQLGVSLMWQALYFGSYAAILLYWNKNIARWVSVPAAWVRYAAIAIIAVGAVGFVRSSSVKMRRWVREARGGRESGRAMVATARKHLSRIRYLQTYTRGLSSGLSLRGLGAQLSRGVSRAQQPLSYPEVVAEFRSFAASVAADVHRRGDRVFIGVDELDKIGSAEQAEHFLNEVKGIFGIPHLYFMVSVSDDALNAFERRGLPLRDAFDSSFDEILRVTPLSYPESRRLLYRRVIGLTEPYVALCHCLAGGLARDVIRAARQVARNAATLTAGASPPAESGAAASGAGTATEDEQPDAEEPRYLPTLSDVSAAVLHDELNRKLRALSQVAGRIDSADTAKLQDTLYDIAAHLAADQPIINLVDIIAKQSQGEPPEVGRVRMDLAAYAYYCATIQEIFTGQLDDKRMIRATSAPAEPDSFDALAAARSAFTTDTLLAWNLITQCRIAWSLETREPAGRNVHNGDSSRPDARPKPAPASVSRPAKAVRAATAGRPATTRTRVAGTEGQPG